MHPETRKYLLATVASSGALIAVGVWALVDGNTDAASTAFTIGGLGLGVVLVLSLLARKRRVRWADTELEIVESDDPPPRSRRRTVALIVVVGVVVGALTRSADRPPWLLVLLAVVGVTLVLFEVLRQRRRADRSSA